MYEGRTRGKRVKYTFSDEDENEDDYDEHSSDVGNRRSTRNTGTNTPAEASNAPTVTLSGRQVKSRHGGLYGESALIETKPSAPTTDGEDADLSEAVNNGRPRRAAATNVTNGVASKGGRNIDTYNSLDDMDDDEDDASEQDYGDEEDDDVLILGSEEEAEDEVMDEEDEEMLDPEEQRSLVVKLSVKTPTPEKVARFQPSEKKTFDLSTSKAPGPSNSDHGQNSSSAVRETTPTPSATKPMSETSTAPINISTNPPSMTPLSPSLAFRGSPEKPPHLQSSINVG